MVSEKVTIKNPTGLHLRPAGLFCQTAMQFECSVTFKAHHDELAANAKSVLSVLGACVKGGDEIEIICSGKDEDAALKEMVSIVQSGLGE